MKRNFLVAGHNFSLSLPDGSDVWERLGNYDPFATGKKNALFSLELSPEAPSATRPASYEAYYSNETNIDEPRLDLFRSVDGWLVEMAPTGRMPSVATLITDKDFRHSTLYVRPGGNFERFAIDNSLMLLYAFRTSTLKTLEMHASVVVNEGEGFLFIAPSGTGKSTHSRLWIENIPGTELLNDDNPVIRIMPDGQVRVFGTPWSGKTPCYKCKDFPAEGIIRIKQAPANRITRLENLQAYASLASSCSGLKAVESMADGLHESLSETVMSVPCYELECLPDPDAAILCHSTVSSHRSIPNGIFMEEVGRMLEEGKEVVILTKGNSMLPFIHGGKDSVRLKKMPAFAKGDIVLAETEDGRYVVHRIIDIGDGRVTLMGDGNLKGTESCSPDGILGTVTGIISPDEKVRIPGKGRLWASLKPFRRYILGIYKRII